MNRTKEKAPKFTKWADLVWSVIRTYVDIKSAPAMSAFNIDPSVTQSARLTPSGIHFLADTERAVDDVLKLHPGERDSLLAAWRSLLRSAMRGDKQLTIIRPAEAVLIAALGPLAASRGLSPREYLRPNRHPKPKTAVTGRARLSMPIMRAA